MAPDLLSASLGISRTAVLQHLRSLAAAGLVARVAVRHGVGRPRHVYDLTSAAQVAFPSNYLGLSRGLLDAVDAIGGRQLVERAFQTRRATLATELRDRLARKGLRDAPLADRARELAVFQDEQGYQAECSREIPLADPSEPLPAARDGVIRMREHNCAILEIARETPAACRAEVQLFRDVLGARVVRETHIAAGARCCTYRIEERPARA